MTNEDPKAELIALRAILAARAAEETEQARRFRKNARDRDDRVSALTRNIAEIDAAVAAIDARRTP